MSNFSVSADNLTIEIYAPELVTLVVAAAVLNPESQPRHLQNYQE